MELLSRANQALPQLPEDVQRVGVAVAKSSSNLLLGVTLISPTGTYDGRFLQNYAEIHVVDPLSRIPGVASVMNFGLSEYAMRIWLDPAKLANLGLTATDVAAAIREQNQQAAVGTLGRAPAPAGQTFEFQLNTLGRLEQVAQFEDIVVRALPNGALVRVRDVGRVELGADTYDWSTSMSGRPSGNVVIFQLADANGLEIRERVVATMDRLARHFPADLEWVIIYDTTMFVRASIREVIVTLLQAIGLVLLVIFVFLQNWRSTLIPTIAVPVSLIGTFAAMAVLGFSINTLSLLGLVVAVALVVDDAIVVVENVNRRLEEGGRDLMLPRRRPCRGPRADHRDHARADGRVRAGRVHPRDHRPALQSVRADHRDRGRAVGHQLLDPQPGAVRGAAAAANAGAACGVPGVQSRASTGSPKPMPEASRSAPASGI